MKQIWINLMVVIVGVFSIYGCGGSPSPHVDITNVRAVALSADDTKAYVVSSGQIEVVDVGMANAPTLLGKCDKKTSASVMHLALSPDGKKLIVANEVHLFESTGGLEIYDVSTPSSPQYLGGHFPGDKHDDYYGVAYSPDGTKVYLSSYDKNSSGLQVVDVRTPSNPQLIKEYDTNGSVGLALSPDGTKVYMVTRAVNSIAIIDVTHPSNPVALNRRVFTRSDAYGITLSADGNTSYMTVKNNLGGIMGLVVMDVGDSNATSLLGQTGTDLMQKYPKLSADGNTLFSIDKKNLNAFDVTNPASPSRIGHYDTENDASISLADFALSSDDTKAYLANKKKGLLIVDVSTPAAPALLGTYK
jgi:hypothetical protein